MVVWILLHVPSSATEPLLAPAKEENLLNVNPPPPPNLPPAWALDYLVYLNCAPEHLFETSAKGWDGRLI